MIKMDLKKHDFLKKEEPIFEGLTISGYNIVDGNWIMASNTTITTANISYVNGTNTTTIAGNVRYNSTTNGNGNLEYFDGVTWRTLNLSAQVV